MRWMVLLLGTSVCEPARPPPQSPPPVQAPRPELGRYQIVSHSAAVWNMVLLDTVTGETWLRCSRPGEQYVWAAWCEMERGEFAAVSSPAKRPGAQQ